MLKRGSIPVTVLTILALVIFVLALLSFSFVAIDLLDGVADSSKFVSEFTIAQNNASYTRGTLDSPQEVTSKDGLLGLFGKDVLEMSVQRIK